MQTPLDPFVPRWHWFCNSFVATMPGLSCRRVCFCLLGIACSLVLLIYTYQQELWTPTLYTENIFPWASPSNVSAHSADDFSRAISRRLNVAADQDASKKKKDGIEEGQVMYLPVNVRSYRCLSRHKICTDSHLDAYSIDTVLQALLKVRKVRIS